MDAHQPPRRSRPVLALIVLLAIPLPSSVADLPAGAIRAVGTGFQLSLPGGRVLTSTELIGAVLSIKDPQGNQQSVRIDAVEPDPTDPQGEILLHSLSVQDSATGTWSNLCEPGPDGLAKAFPLSGTWTPDGRHLRDDTAFSLACTGGAIGKCVRWGYKPWQRGPHGEDLWDYHQACARMVRADYGGDGVGHTRDGTPIDVYDQAGIVPPAADPAGLTFEAAWGTAGALCLRKPRLADIVSLPELERRYPALLGRTGDACREDRTDGRALIFNRS